MSLPSFSHVSKFLFFSTLTIDRSKAVTSSFLAKKTTTINDTMFLDNKPIDVSWSNASTSSVIEIGSSELHEAAQSPNPFILLKYVGSYLSESDDSIELRTPIRENV